VRFVGVSVGADAGASLEGVAVSVVTGLLSGVTVGTGVVIVGGGSVGEGAS
jgi:hypothetical protein